MSDPQRMSDGGLRRLQRFELCRLYLYRDAGGRWTIGWGHLVTKRELESGAFAHGITQAMADELLRRDLQRFELCIDGNVKVPLNQNQRDALLCCLFNCGEGFLEQRWLLDRLNAGDYSVIPAEMQHWIHVDGVENAGLKYRRKLEAALWNAPIGLTEADVDATLAAIDAADRLETDDVLAPLRPDTPPPPEDRNTLPETPEA